MDLRLWIGHSLAIVSDMADPGVGQTPGSAM